MKKQQNDSARALALLKSLLFIALLSISGVLLTSSFNAVLAVGPDSDGDGIPDSQDNCPTAFNPGQEDSDGDGIGDVCDNCPFTPNPGQEDSNGNSIGDACDLVITVTNTNDSGPGSLRQALADATDGDLINFDPTLNGAVITLTTGELSVNDNVFIFGPGADMLAVSGNHASRVFHIASGKTAYIISLTIINGTINGNGGGIYNDHASLELLDCTISGNSAVNGGGIYNDHASLLVSYSSLTGNSAGSGGGILNDAWGGSATLEVLRSTVSGNSATNYGGGILNNGESGSATMEVLNSTLSGNTSASDGGGIYNYGDSGNATLEVLNSTLSGNSATSGGGILNDAWGGSATLEVLNSTLSQNSASGVGGGIVNLGGGATSRFSSTIFNASSIYNSSGTITSLGYNLSNDAAGGDATTDPGGFLDDNGDIRNTDPKLGPLQDNGPALRPTFTHALLPDSPAIHAGAGLTALNDVIDNVTTSITVANASSIPAGDGGLDIRIDDEQMFVVAKNGNTLTVLRATNSTTAASHSSGAAVNPAFDQRGYGFNRVVTRIDIGSFEVQQPPPITVTNTNDSGSGSLRSALASAVNGDTIDFDLTYPATIALTTGQLVVGSSVTIRGPGANNLTVDGNANDRAFYISLGATVTIDGVSIRNGHVAGSIAGGGIYNDHATLTLSNCTVSGNSAGSGGGIFNNGGSRALFGSAALTVNNCTVSGNSAGAGGGVYNDAGQAGVASLTVNNSTLSGNSASTGGGILNTGFGDDDITISSLTVTNSTISGNLGGGIYNGSFSTLSLSTTLVGGTILNTGGSGENIHNVSGPLVTVISLGYNLSNDNGGGYLMSPGDQINTNPIVGPLQDNGGPTFTHALLPGSPAVDGGDPSFTSPPDYDQRGLGFPRVMNSRIDIGSFEVQSTSSPTPTPTTTSTPTPTATSTPTATATATSTSTPTATATATATATPTAMATATPTPTPTATPAYAAQIQQPIDPDGTSVFNVRRGVIPVKFTVTLNGVATCNLPSATIAVTRTAGGTIGPVGESVYSGPADNGSNFRIDSCQYIYNLSASALGVGTYRVDIMINSQVVGSASFGLR